MLSQRHFQPMCVALGCSYSRRFAPGSRNRAKRRQEETRFVISFDSPIFVFLRRQREFLWRLACSPCPGTLVVLFQNTTQSILFDGNSALGSGVSKYVYVKVKIPRVAEYLIANSMQRTGRDLFGFTEMVLNLFST
jgi:hypothetical protein